MRVYIHASHIHTCGHTYIGQTYVHAGIHTCGHAYINVGIHTYMWVYIRAYNMRAYIHVDIHSAYILT